MRRKTPIILAVVALILMTMIGCSTAKILQVGDKAPAFTLESIDGKNVSLSDFQGKTVLIVFTSVNCKECEKQMPYLVGAYQQENGKLAVLDIYHMIFDARLVRDYVTNKQFTTFPALPDPNNTVANAYGATRYPPTNFIIDAAGIIKYKKIGRFQSQEEIEDILKSL
ncbi:MAG: TlpA disulfide reductase family protein [Dehalococcoidia bacterium]